MSAADRSGVAGPISRLRARIAGAVRRTLAMSGKELHQLEENATHPD